MRRSLALTLIVLAAGVLMSGAVAPSHATLPLRDACSVSAGTVVVVGIDGSILRSTDAGLHWTEATVNWPPISAGPPRDFFAVAFFDATHGIAAGSIGYGTGTGDPPAAMTTSDGGLTWFPMSGLRGLTGFVEDLAVLDSTTAVGVGWSDSAPGTGYARIVRTTDRGATWQRMAYRPLNADGQGVSFSDPLHGVAVFTFTGSRIAVTSDGGLTWADDTALTDLLGVHVDATGTGYAVGSQGTVYATHDTGVTWTPLASGTAETLYSVHFIDPQNALAVGGHGVVVQTTDGGATWSVQQPTTADLFSALVLDGSVRLAVGEIWQQYRGIVVRSTDGGQIWTDTPVPVQKTNWGQVKNLYRH